MISMFTAEQADAAIEQLASLLIDSVEGGASVGFLPPLRNTDARSYWREVIDAIRSGSRLLLAATDEGRIAGRRATRSGNSGAMAIIVRK